MRSSTRFTKPWKTCWTKKSVKKNGKNASALALKNNHMKWLLVILSLLASVAFSGIRMNPNKILQEADEDSLQAQRDKYLNEIRKAIAGKENDPVDSVFHNLKVLGGFPASN